MHCLHTGYEYDIEQARQFMGQGRHRLLPFDICR